MTGNSHHLPEAWLSQLGGRDVSGWLSAFVEQPQEAVADLLWDRFYFGPLNLTHRRQLLTGWLGHLNNSERFAERLDAEFNKWVKENWDRFERSGESLASAWSCLCNVVEFSAKLHRESALKNCAAALRERFQERNSFLGSFSTAPAADPLGSYLAVIAEFQGEDRSLAAFWHQLCELPDGIPFYHGRYAMQGLRRIRSPLPSHNGTLRAEIVRGLINLAKAFDRLVNERKLEIDLAASSFSLIAKETAGGYHDSSGWEEYGTAEALKLSKRAQDWLRVVPRLHQGVERERKKMQETGGYYRPRSSIAPEPNWVRRAMEIASRLRNRERNCLPDAIELLTEQTRYAEATGDAYYITHSLRNFAKLVLPLNSEVALRWALAALKWDPYSQYSWTIIRTVLLHQRRYNEALAFAWVAWKRLPEDVEVYTALADALNIVERYSEALEIYRQALERFPAQVRPRNGFADTLRRLRRRGEAEAEYRQIIKLGQADPATYVGLATLVLRAKREGARQEGLDLLDRALELNPGNEYVLGLKQKLMRSDGTNVEELVAQWDDIPDVSFEPTQHETRGHFPAQEDLVGIVHAEEREHESSSTHTFESKLTATAPGEKKLMTEEQAAKGRSPQSITSRDKHPEVIEESARMRPAENSATEQSDEVAVREHENVATPLAESAVEDAPSLLAKEEAPKRYYFSPGQNITVAALLAEAYFYRTQSIRLPNRLWHRKAEELIERAEALSPENPHVLAEKAVLSMKAGDKLAVRERLRVELNTHPAAVSLLMVKARLDREVARDEKRRLTEQSLTELCISPQRLRSRDPSFGPLFHYQRGLAALALTDGNARRERAADAFSSFRRKLSFLANVERDERATDPKKTGERGFHEWVEGQVDTRVFAGIPKSNEVTSQDVAMLDENWEERRSAMQEVEDVFADRLAFRAFEIA